MQTLTGQLETGYPGVIVYGIGNEEHKRGVSGHNEDDTPGVRAEDQDSDSVREHRALDVMRGNAFSHADAVSLVTALVSVRANQRRLLYVIYDHQIWSRSHYWVVRPYTGSDPHTGHVHISGEADDDGNTAPWNLNQQETEMTVVVHERDTYEWYYGNGEWWEPIGNDVERVAAVAAFGPVRELPSGSYGILGVRTRRRGTLGPPAEIDLDAFAFKVAAETVAALHDLSFVKRP